MAPTTVALATPPPPGLAEATKNSTTAWQHHLAELFRTAKERFPDVVWELEQGAEVWGHKAIVYARAPPSFQSRYFSFRPNAVTAYSQSPFESAVSLDRSRSPSPVRPASPSTLTPNTSLLRISSSINPALFSNELEYLYTGQGFGEAFEFLFDSADSHDPDHHVDPDDLRIDKLRKDLVFMWRSRLYSDVRIALSGNFSSSSHESTTAIFSSHRFILVSRSPYFYDALLSWPTNKSASTEIPTLTLPSPPFTPPSLHFTLGFIYTGTLVFSHRTYDLSTAFAILRSALYLSLTTLHDEIQARIANEMLHGLFHAFLPFQEYERLTASKWGTGGCRCRQCARRVPRVLEFSLEPDVKNTNLERGARRALVGLFGEGWCTNEFANLPLKLRESLLKGVAKRTTPQNVFPLLFSAEHALLKLSSNVEPWADTVREMILTGRKLIDETICKEADTCFAGEEWMEIMDTDAARFEDNERVEWVMNAVLRGVKESWAATLYQTLVSSVLIKSHPTEPNSTLLSPTSPVRQQVETTRIELLKWISKRWLQIRQEHGFDALEGWAIKEISDYMEVPIEDLLSPAPPARGSPRNNKNLNSGSHLRPVSNHPHTSRIDADSEAASSMRVSVLSRNLAASRRAGPSSIRERDNASVHSTTTVSSIRTTSAKSAVSTTSGASDSTIGRSSTRTGETSNAHANNTGGMSPAKRIIQATRAKDAAHAAAAAAKARTVKERPDSKLTPASPITSSPPTPTKPELNLLPPDDDDRIETGETGVVGSPVTEDDEDDRASIANSEAPTEPDSPSTSTTPVKKKTVITRASLNSAGSRASAANVSVRSKPSSASVRSQAASITTAPRKSTATGASKGKPSVGGSARPVSRTSTRLSMASSTLSRSSTARSSATTASATSSTSTSTTTTTASSSTTSTTSSRPVSAVSTSSGSTANHRTSTLTTESAGSYRTANSGGGLATPQAPRSRKSSAASTTSVRTAGPTTNSKEVTSPVSPISPSPRTRRISSASVSSVHSTTTTSTTTSSVYGTPKGSVVSKNPPPPPVPPIDPTKLLSPVGTKTKTSPTATTSSVRSVRSVSSIKKPPVSPGAIRSSTSVGGSPVVQSGSSASVPAVTVGESKPSVVELKTTPPTKLEEMIVTPTTTTEEEQEIKNSPSTITIKPSMTHSSSDINIDDSRDDDDQGNNNHKKSDSTTSTESTATVKKRRSNETIVGVSPPIEGGGPSSTSSGGVGLPVPSSSNDKPRMLDKPLPIPMNVDEPIPSISHNADDDIPRGATLEIGIPCIVSSKRKRFKAYARYIGEVIGEYGPWVGVEVPIPLGESWADRDLDMSWKGTQWNDGTWAGIRYFQIGNGKGGSGGGGGGGEYDYSYEVMKKRRIGGDGSVGGGGREASYTNGKKREGEQLVMGMERMKRMRSASPAVSDASVSESRGLFVRPQQVLYVVDAMEDL